MKSLVLDIHQDGKFEFLSDINAAMLQAEHEVEVLEETISSVEGLKPECDKLDYALAASSGALCGLIDVFLIGKPGSSPIGDITDSWFENRTRDFAKLNGWKPKKGETAQSAIDFLERKFKIPYDQRGCGDAGSEVFGLNPKNHHFKSLAHNPTLVGLFFSILDQFTNSSHFISDGTMIELLDADGEFYLRGRTIPAKIWSGFVNWFGHLISDVSGASGSSSQGNRGMGIPSPLWAWSNSIIAIKSKMGLNINSFDRSFNDIALELFNQGYDSRFQTAQAIPVFINELLVRLMYLTRRLVKYFSVTTKTDFSFKTLWNECKPFGNPTIERMLTVAHGTFILVDVGDATIRAVAKGGGNFNPVEFFLRLNLIGVGRLSISLYGEAKREINLYKAEKRAEQANTEKSITEEYIKGLRILGKMYDDKDLLTLADDMEKGYYKVAFEKSVELVTTRGGETALRDKQEIDNYFNNKYHEQK